MAIAPGSITSANAVFTLSIATLYSAPQQIQMFGVDDAFDSEAVENKEVVKGVDNFIAAGWKPTLPKLNVNLLANSISNAIFDLWFQTEQTPPYSALPAQGIITLPSLRMQYVLLNAYLFSYMHIAPAKTTLKDRKHVLICDDISYTPI